MGDDKAIIDRFNWGQDSLVTQSADLSLKSVADMIRDEVIDISPKYQRRDRWDQIKQAGLIESFLLNIPVPPIYLAETAKGDYSVIDGKQRLTAIFHFIHKKLTLTGLERFVELEGYQFDSLPSTLQGPLKVRPYLRVVTLLQQSDSELKHEVFLRLNKSGVRLNSQEIRNVAYRGLFNDMLMSVAENKYFRKQLNVSPKSRVYTEMLDVQFALRAFTIANKWKEFPGNMDKAMDDFMEEHYQLPSSGVEKARKNFLESLELCEEIWGDSGFYKPGGTKKALQGYFDIHLVPLMLLSKPQRLKLGKKTLEIRRAVNRELNDNDSYVDSISSFTSNPERVRTRIGQTLSILKNIYSDS